MIACRRSYPRHVITRRALALVLSLLLPAGPAAAQVRVVPAEAGSAPLVAPAGYAPAFSFSPSLTTSLSAPSLGVSLNAPAPALHPSKAPAIADAVQTGRPLVLAPAALGLAVTPAATIASRPDITLAEGHRKETSAPRDAVKKSETFLIEHAGRTIPDTDLDALFDGRRSASGLAAATPENVPGDQKPALKPSKRGRIWRVAAITVPAVVVAAVFGAATPHLALLGLHWLGQAAYWLANPFAFAFTLPQIHRMLTRRSADVSTSMMVVGLLATVAMAANFAFDGKDLMMYRNLAQAAGFGVMLYLKSRFGRATPRAAPSRTRAALETAAVALVITGLMALTGPLLAAALPGIAAMSSLLVPLQVAAGFGFTYLMYAQLSKMRRSHSAGDSSAGMMWAYLGTKTIWVWSFATMLALSTAPAWLTLSAGALFTGICWFAGKAALSRLLKAPWSFLPEKIGFMGRTLTRDVLAEIGAFLVLSALILALSAGGYLAFTAFLGIPAAATPRFAMYLLYMVQSLVACLATMKTLKMRAAFDKKKD